MTYIARAYCPFTDNTFSISAEVPEIEGGELSQMRELVDQGILVQLTTSVNTNAYFMVAEAYRQLRQEMVIMDDEIRFKIMNAKYRDQYKLSDAVDQNLGFINWLEMAPFVFAGDKETHDPLQMKRKLFYPLSDFTIGLNKYKKPRFNGTTIGANLRKRVVCAERKMLNIRILRLIQHGPNGMGQGVRCSMTGVNVEDVLLPGYKSTMTDMDIHHIKYINNTSSNKSEVEPSKLLTSVMKAAHVFELIQCVFLTHNSHKFIHSKFSSGQDLRFWERIWRAGRGTKSFALLSRRNYEQVAKVLQDEFGFKDFLKKYPYTKLVAQIYVNDIEARYVDPAIDAWFEEEGIM